MADAVYMLALSIRQPYAELILRGEKTIEYRSRPTKLIGQRFYIYAARTPGPPEAWASVNGQYNGFAPSSGPSPGPRNPPDPRNPAIPQPNGLPTGVIVGSAVIAKCVALTSRDREEAVPSGGATDPLPDGRGSLTALYEWHLVTVKRYKHPRKVKRQPQVPGAVWFTPF